MNLNVWPLPPPPPRSKPPLRLASATTVAPMSQLPPLYPAVHSHVAARAKRKSDHITPLFNTYQ